MSKEDDVKKLTKHFKAMGAGDSELWAASEIEEKIPQFSRYLFLKTAWKNVVPENNDQWIDNTIKRSQRFPDEPCAAAGPILQRMLDAGISRQDIVDFVRTQQYAALFGICYQLSDSSTVEYPRDDIPKVNWALFQTNDEGKPVVEIGALHESLLGMDPTGREMRPRD